MKKCCICEIEKNENEFSWKLKSKNRRHSQCKECKRKIDNDHYLSSKNRRELLKKNGSKRNKYLRDYVQRVKRIFGKCNICGDKRWYVLDFHHLENKEFEISVMVRSGYSIKKIKKELRKCIFLCSNCHREHHFFENNGTVV